MFYQTGITDFIVVLAILAILLLFSTFHKEKQLQNQQGYYKYYLGALGFKLFGSVLFGVIYLFVFGYGGDTLAYYYGAKSVANLLFQEPSLFLSELFGQHSTVNYYNYYNSETTYPPIWLYISNRHFFLCKIASFLYLITFGSFWGMTILMGYFSFIANWKLFKIIMYYFPKMKKSTVLSTLFIPSVAVWCSGLMKDTVIFISICYIIYYTFLFFELKKIRLITYLFSLLILFILIIQIKAYILFVVTPAILVWFLFSFGQKIKNKFIRIIVIRLMMVLVFSGAFVVYLQSGSALQEFSADKIIERAYITQQDFVNNQSYEGKKYSIGEVDMSLIGFLKTAPQSIIAGLFRPFLWESSSIVTIFSGLENAIILVLFIWALARSKIIFLYSFIKSNPTLSASALITITLGFISGFTAGLFGTLVRFKAPMLPFFVTLLVITIHHFSSKNYSK